MPITDKVHPLYAVRLWRMGKSLVFPLYTAVANALHAEQGDLLLVRVHPPYITMRVGRPDSLMPVEQFTENELPPEWPKARKTGDERSR